MNRTKIEYLTHTWNPVTGCLHGCPYCFAKNITHRFGEHQKGDGVLHELVEYEGTRIDLRSENYNPTSFSLGKKAVGIHAYRFGFDPTLHTYRLDEPETLKNKPLVAVPLSVIFYFSFFSFRCLEHKQEAQPLVQCILPALPHSSQVFAALSSASLIHCSTLSSKQVI